MAHRLIVLVVAAPLCFGGVASATDGGPVLAERAISGNAGIAYRVTVASPSEVTLEGEALLPPGTPNTGQGAFGAWLLNRNGDVLGDCLTTSHTSLVGGGGSAWGDGFSSCGSGGNNNPRGIGFSGEAIFDLAPGMYILASAMTVDRAFTGRLLVRAHAGVTVEQTVDGSAFHFSGASWDGCLTLVPNVAMAACTGTVEIADSAFGWFDNFLHTGAMSYNTPDEDGSEGVRFANGHAGSYSFTVHAHGPQPIWAWGADIPIADLLRG